MKETRRKPRNLLFSISDTGSLICPVASRHGCTFQGLWLPSRGALGGNRNVQPREDSNRQHIGSVEHATNWAILAPPEDHITPGAQQGGSSPNRGGGGDNPATRRPPPWGRVNMVLTLKLTSDANKMTDYIAQDYYYNIGRPTAYYMFIIAYQGLSGVYNNLVQHRC